MRTLMISCILFLIILGSCYHLVCRVSRNVAQWDRENRYIRGVFLIASCCFLVTVYFSGEKSLWYDDLYQIQFSGQGQNLKTVLRNIINIDLQPPVFAVISMLWLKIAPYGTAWIRLISEIAVFFSILFIGIAGNRIAGSRGALICAFLLGSSAPVILDGAYSFRPYGYAVLIITLLILCYQYKVKHPGIRNNLLFGLFMVAAVMTHYMCGIVCGGLLIFDFIRFLRKKAKFSSSLSYFLLAGLILPWLSLTFGKVSEQIAEFWPTTPNITGIYKILKYMSGNQEYLYILFVMGLVYVVMGIQRGKWNFYEEQEFPIICGSVVLIFIGILFLYSTIINPKGSVWVKRYFVVVMPFFILFVGNILNKVLASVSKAFPGIKTASGMLACTLLLLIGLESLNRVYGEVTEIYEPFEEAANILNRQEDIRDEKVLLYSSTTVGKGWSYYLTRNGKLPEILWADNTNLYDRELSAYQTIYVFDVHDKCKMPDEFQDFLDEKYKKEVVHKRYQIYRYTMIDE